MKTMNINQLPEHVKNQILSHLEAYDTAYATLENGEITYTAGLMLTNRVKAPDFTTFEFKAKDIYTEEERAENYHANFGGLEYQYAYDRDSRKWEIWKRGELVGRYDNRFQCKTECGALNR